MASASTVPPNIRDPVKMEEEKEFISSSFTSFLNGYVEAVEEPTTSSGFQTKEYEEIAKAVVAKDRTTVEVDFMHVSNFDPELADRIRLEYFQHEKTLRSSLNSFVKRVVANPDTAAQEYNLSFYNIPEQVKLRDLRTDRIGCLSRITGTVTRTSEVRPELMSAHFQCLECYTEQDPTEQQFKYTEPAICKNPTCANRKRWYLNIDKSKFADFQRIRIQENSNEIPAGSMPRSMDVIVRNEMVDRAKPGDRCSFTGCLIVVPDVAQLKAAGERAEAVRETGNRSNTASEGVTGLKSLGVRELTYKLCFLGCAVHLAEKDGWSHFREEGEETAEELDEETRKKIAMMNKSPQLYQRMVSSLCPTVFGHDEVKKGILLMLLGGVHKTTKTQTNLRGDINVCVVGDPSTAKSQFLKFVADFMPRAIYTSGKASSAAGLTASVARDSETGEFGIEAGALMLADNGICCIDEFDKMDIKDQVAIHEAMEQQTISIAKAGIQATLNARTSILAAANPRDGRYDRSKSLKGNVDISPPIMSRFDLFFVILDECDEIADYNIARHIIQVHQKGASEEEEADGGSEFSKEEMQRYIRYARNLKPKMTEGAKRKLVEHYRELRENDCQGAQRAAYRITVRQLESMIRLSEALAKLHCDEEVSEKYVDEAKRLLKMSIIHVDSGDVNLVDFDAPQEEERDREEREEGEEDGDDEDGGDDGDGDEQGGAGRRTRKQSKSRSPSKSPKKRKEEEQEAGKKAEEAAPPAKKPKLEISQTEYDQIALLLMGQLRAREERDEEEWTQSELINWYLDQRDDIDSEEGLALASRIVSSIVQRLIVTEHWIIILNEDEVRDMAGSAAERRNARKLAVHPNWMPPNA